MVFDIDGTREAARQRAICADRQAPGAAVPAEILEVQTADRTAELVPARITVVTSIELDLALWLEAEARLFVVPLRSAFPRWRGLHHRRLDLLDRRLKGFDLRLKQLNLGLSIVDRVRVLDGGVRRRVGLIRFRLLGHGRRLGWLAPCRCRDRDSATNEQRSDKLQLHFEILPPWVQQATASTRQAGRVVHTLLFD